MDGKLAQSFISLADKWTIRRQQIVQGSVGRIAATLGSLLVLSVSGAEVAWAWGSSAHSEIVQAALSVIPIEDGIYRQFGREADMLAEYVLMADWRNSFVSIDGRPAAGNEQASKAAVQFYANDYLLFPNVQRHISHSPPDAVNAYRPYFLRALQAMRTESEPNAARWVGALLHYVTDSGSPPHAANIKGIPGGGTHYNMENWVKPSEMDIKSYRAQLFGSTDEEAVLGLERRMAGLVEFSRRTAKRLQPCSDANDRPACESICIDAARETALVVVDVIHTLLTLSRDTKVEKGSELFIDISAPSVAGMDLVPAKLVFLNTLYSTLSDRLPSEKAMYRGRFALRNVPPGTYAAIIYVVGAQLIHREVTVDHRRGSKFVWVLEPGIPAGNLVRNPDFKVRWLTKDKPDQWTYESTSHKWVSDNIKVEVGKKYRTIVSLNVPSSGKVYLQWMAEHWLPLGEPICVDCAQKGSRHIVDAIPPPNVQYAPLIVKSSDDPSTMVKSIALLAGD